MIQRERAQQGASLQAQPPLASSQEKGAGCLAQIKGSRLLIGVV